MGKIRWESQIGIPLKQTIQNTCLVRDAVESVVLDELPEEGDDPLRAVRVHVGQVDLVAEHHQPLPDLGTMRIGEEFQPNFLLYL